MTCVRGKRDLNEVFKWSLKKRKLEKVTWKVCVSCDGISVSALKITYQHSQLSKCFSGTKKIKTGEFFQPPGKKFHSFCVLSFATCA